MFLVNSHLTWSALALPNAYMAEESCKANLDCGSACLSMAPNNVTSVHDVNISENTLCHQPCWLSARPALHTQSTGSAYE